MSMNKRGAAAIAGAALTAAVLPMIGAAPANAANVTIDKSFAYGCDTNAGGLGLGVKQVGVRATFSAPSQLYPGQTVAATAAKITLTLPEDLRSATKGLLQSNYVDGKSTDAGLDVATTTASGTTTKPYLISGLVAARQAVPNASPWTVVVNGKSPAIPVATNATAVSLSMPAKFTINATVYKQQADTTGTAVTMVCTTTASRVLTPTPLKVVKLSPTVAATITPSEITTSSTPVVSVTASSAKTPTGNVYVLEGTKTLASGPLTSGKASITLPKFTTTGTKTLTIKYAGNSSNNAASITKTITVG